LEGLRIRVAVPRDIRRMSELEEACFEESYPMELLAFFVMDSRFISLVAEVDQVIVGMAVAELEDKELKKVGHIWTVEVLPPYRRKGIAMKLLTELEERLRARGATECYLEVRTDNEPAIRLYEKLGYEKVGIIRDYYCPGVDAFFMVKDLTKMSPGDLG